MYIYKTTSKIDGRFYIGKSEKSIEETKNYFGSGILIKNLIKKYGKENFVKEILFETNEKEELNKKEIFFIENLNAFNRKSGGLNIAKGGTGGDTISHHPDIKRISKNYKKWSKKYWTEEKKQELSLKYTGENNPFAKKKHKKESKDAISIKKLGKPNSKKTNKKISKTLKRKYESGEIIKVVSEESKIKMSNSHINIKHTKETKEQISKKLTGRNNPSSKKWIFINKNGKRKTIKGEFQKFCIENSLSIKVMRNIADNKRKSKFHNNWTVKRV